MDKIPCWEFHNLQSPPNTVKSVYIMKNEMQKTFSKHGVTENSSN
jgi:hypothetical protein